MNLSQLFAHPMSGPKPAKGASRQRGAKTPRPQSHQLHLEHLEDKCLLDAGGLGLQPINFNDYTIGHYGDDSDADGTVTVEDGGATLHIEGNRWVQIGFDYTVTPDTVIEFDFQSTVQGEHHGFGFDNNLAFSAMTTFKLYGTQDFGHDDFDNYGDDSAGAVKHYKINVGDYFASPPPFQYLFFSNDNDVANPTNNSFFSNVLVYEELPPAAPEANHDAFTVAEDSGTTTLDVLGNDTDVNQDALSIVGVTQGSEGGTVSVNGACIDYTPADDFFGTETFTYTIDDGNGGQDTATVTMTVDPVADDPFAIEDEAITNEDEGLTIDVLDNDGDDDGETLTIETVTQGSAGGSVTINGSSVDYVPAENFHGTETFTYTIDDGNGGTDTATVTVTVNPVADAPVANDDSATTTGNESVTVNVVANDTDADNDSLTVSAVTDGSNGTVIIADDQSVTYTPNEGFVGTDSFTYTVDDGNGGFAVATVVVTVTQPQESDPCDRPRRRCGLRCRVQKIKKKIYKKIKKQKANVCRRHVHACDAFFSNHGRVRSVLARVLKSVGRGCRRA